MIVNEHPEYVSDKEIAFRRTEILKKIAKDMEKGMRRYDVLAKYKQEYMDYAMTELNINSVARAFLIYVDPEKRERIMAEKKAKAVELADQGVSIDEIAEIVDLSDPTVRKLLHEGKKTEVVHRQKPEGVSIFMEDVEEFRDSVSIGKVLDCNVRVTEKNIKGVEIVRVYREKVKVLEKYPHIAITDKGCFRWIDLYLYWKERNKQ